MYNRALSDQEITTNYTSNLSKVNSGNWILNFWPDFSTGLRQSVFGYTKDSAGNMQRSPSKTLIRDVTPPEIQLSNSSSGGRITTTNFRASFDINETNFANKFLYSISGQTYNIFDSGVQLFLNFDDLRNLPPDNTFGLTNIAPWRNNYILANQVLHTPGLVKSGYVLRDSNVYLAPGTGHE